MYTLLLVLIVLATILMVGIVLIQESKGGGLAANFSAYNQIGGVRKTTDFIEKTTWGLAAAMVVISVFCAYVAPRHSPVANYKGELNPENAQGIEAAPIAPVEAPAAEAAPAEGAAPAEAPAE